MPEEQLIDNLIDGLLEATAIALVHAGAQEGRKLVELLEEISSHFDPIDPCEATPNLN